MKIFITGGTGLLGKSVVNRLLQEENKLYILSRKKRSEDLYKNPKITMVEGSLENISEWQNQLKGMDIVIHMAAPVVFWGPWNMYQKSIVDSTEELFHYTEKNRIGKFIYISSESVLQNKKDLININEDEPYPKEPNSYYGKSKMLAEKFLLSRESPVTRIIIRPTFIWGDNVPGLDLMAEKIKQGKFMWIDHGKPIIEMVHVDNVAEAIALAAYNAGKTDIFFVTDDNPKSAKEFFTSVLAVKGIKISDKSLPNSIARPLATVVELFWKTFNLKGDPLLTRFDLAFIGMSRKYNISKIKKQLNYQPVIDFQTALQRLKK